MSFCLYDIHTILKPTIYGNLDPGLALISGGGLLGSTVLFRAFSSRTIESEPFRRTNPRITEMKSHYDIPLSDLPVQSSAFWTHPRVTR